MDLVNDYYLVNFTNEEDYNFVLFEGPWIILDHYLIVRKWFTGFNPSKDIITKVSTWVRFPGLPIDLFNDAFLSNFGDALGKTLKVDTTTLKRSRGSLLEFALILILQSL